MFVITGGGSGIGRALAIALSLKGKEVLIVGRREEKLIETQGFSSKIAYCVADISRQEGRNAVVQKLQSRKLEGLVHNAGMITPILPLRAIEEKDWSRLLKTNLDAPLFLTQALLPALEGGRVLHVGSGVAYFPVAGWGGYCVSKAALAMLTRVWQLEESQVAFTSVKPGIIDTDMQATVRSALHMQKEKQDFFCRLKKEHRLLSEATVALFLCWLLLEVEPSLYQQQEWDIYDLSHHKHWLVPPHEVPSLE